MHAQTDLVWHAGADGRSFEELAAGRDVSGVREEGKGRVWKVRDLEPVLLVDDRARAVLVDDLKWGTDVNFDPRRQRGENWFTSMRR